MLFHCGRQVSGLEVINGLTEAALYLLPHKLESHSAARPLCHASAGVRVISGREAPCPARTSHITADSRTDPPPPTLQRPTNTPSKILSFSPTILTALRNSLKDNL